MAPMGICTWHPAAPPRPGPDDATRGSTQAEASELAAARAVIDDVVGRSSLLGDRGRNDVLQGAFEDGSSVVCVRCGDLVARARWAAHQTTWCRMLPPAPDSDEEEEDA